MSRGADLVIRALTDGGVGTVFSLSGNQIMPVYDACLEAQMRLIHTRHEAAAVFMAEGYAQASGKIGVALVTAGAGLANAIAPLLTASASHTPVLLLSGDSPIGQDGRGAFQEMDQTSLADSITKLSVRAESGADISKVVEDAINVAQAGRPGPVHVSLPADVLEAKARGTESASSTSAATPELDIDWIMSALAEAERPLVLLGPALTPSRLSVELSSLGAPVIAMESPRGLNDPSLGRIRALCEQTDFVLSLGKPVDFTLQFGSKGVWPNARWIVVDATEAECERARRNVEDRLIRAMQADPEAVSAALANGSRVTSNWAGWRDEVDATVSERPVTPPSRDTISSVDLCVAVDKVLQQANDPIYVCDGGEIGQWAQTIVPPGKRIINGVSGAIGGGICYAMGAKAAAPSSDVILIMGDGTAGFHLAEFETAARAGLPFVAIVGNDQRWNAEHQIQIRSFGQDRTHSCELSGARYDLAAEALGAYGLFVRDRDELDSALSDALSSGRPSCVNVEIEGLPAPKLD